LYADFFVARLFALCDGRPHKGDRHGSRLRRKDEEILGRSQDRDHNEPDRGQRGTQDLKRLKLIDSAITRIQQGKYGLCMKCGKRIPTDRLEAIPYALMCIECKAEEERRNR
jgi:RNA polymerase-binding transcription factor DksA